mgnify:FL=1
MRIDKVDIFVVAFLHEPWLGPQEYNHIDAPPKYIVNGDAQWELTMQLIEPQFNITTF